jgi:hypothetical protein
MTDRARTAGVPRRFVQIAAAALLVSQVVTCGGGATSTGSSAPTATGGGGGVGEITIGEPFDATLVEAAAETLAGLDSYVYEASIIQTGGSDTRTQTVEGIVRTAPEEARYVSYTAAGDTIVLVSVDGKDYADYGDGFIEVTADNGTREETDPLAIRALYASFSGVSDDMVVAGTETLHGIETVHLVLDEDVLAERREQLGEGAEGWIAELWLAVADGQLVKAVWGGPQAPKPAAFSAPWYTIDVTDTNCACPVIVPG